MMAKNVKHEHWNTKQKNLNNQLKSNFCVESSKQWNERSRENIAKNNTEPNS